MKLILLLVLLVIGAGFIGMVKLLGWWTLAAIPVVAYLFFKLAGFALRKAFVAPFKAKGAVLHNAGARVHSVTPVARPPRAEEEDEPEDDGPREYYQIEVTITPPSPRPGQSFGMWEPGELRLGQPHDTADSEDGGVCELLKTEVKSGGRFDQDEGMKYSGAQTLRLTAAVKPGVHELKFLYYFESFGRVQLGTVTPVESRRA